MNFVVGEGIVYFWIEFVYVDQYLVDYLLVVESLQYVGVVVGQVDQYVGVVFQCWFDLDYVQVLVVEDFVGEV